MSRAKKEKELFGEDKLALTSEDKRFATPAAPALYRAERLRCETIVDLCSGLGFQSFAFAQTCKKVIAIEKNPLLHTKAQKHAKKLGISNITFLCGDALSSEIIGEIKTHSPDIVFCDPERSAGEEQRSVLRMQPNISKLLQVYFSITAQIAIEFPPHIQTIELPLGFSAEYEYISLNGAVNRLTLYFGSLRECAKKVVLLPEKEILCSTDVEYPAISSAFPFSTSSSPLPFYSYLLESNTTVALAGLAHAAFSSALGEQFKIIAAAKEIVSISSSKSFAKFSGKSSDKKIFYISCKLFKSPFFTVYHIHKNIPYAFDISGKKKILKELQHLGAGRVVLRYALDPIKYWEERSFFEKFLSDGTKQFHLFVFDQALICEKL